jgi:hypothetical protein
MDSRIPSDEIDLRDLVLKTYLILRKRYLYILIISLLTALFLYSVRSKEPYISNYVIAFNIENNNGLYDVGVELCDELSKMIENRDFVEISRLLKIDAETLSSITSVKTFSNASKTNSNYIPTGISVEISHFDSKKAYEFINKMIEYLNNSPFISKLQIQNTQRIKSIINISEKELIELDKLLSGSKNKIIEIENIDGILEHRYNVSNQLTNLQYKLKVYESFYLVNNQNTLIQKSNLIKSIFKFIGIGFILSIIVISVLEFIVFVKNLHDNYKNSNSF